MGTAPKQNQTRNVEKAQLKKYVKSYNSHKFYHDGDGNDDKNVEFDEYE